MKKINKNYSKRGKNAQHVTLVTDIKAAVPQEVAEQYGFLPQWTAFSTAGDNELACFKPDRGYLATVKIEETDKGRDDAFMFYFQLVNAYADYCPDAEKMEAGKTLAFAFHEAGEGSLTVLDYTSETATLNDLVEKLQQEPYASALAVLGIEEAPEVIKAKNDAFTEVFRGRYAEERTRAYAVNMKDLRPKTDEAFVQMAEAINALYAVNELVTKDPTTREALGKVIDDVNGALVHYRKITSGSSSSGSDEPTPEPEPITPEITAVYQKEGGDPENPHRIERGEQTGVKYQGFTLKGADGTLEHVIGLVNDQDYIEWIKPETITNVTETSCEFTMVPDLTEGQYKVRIETYDGGSPLVVEYPEPITLW